MKIVTLKITGGRGDKIAQFYDCGKLGDTRYEKAQKLLDGGGETADVKEFIDEHFEAPNVETFMHSLDEDTGGITLSVEDENGGSVFVDEEYKAGITQRGFVLADPRTWEFDESMGKRLTDRIKAFVASRNDEIDEALAQWNADCPGQNLDETFGDDYLCDLADGVGEMILQAPFVDSGYGMNCFYESASEKSPECLFAVMCADLYGTGCMACEIELADDEEFDPGKLRLILGDYDGFYYYCADSVLPVALYGNKFYRLERSSWEVHHQYYGFAKKREGGSDFRFSGEYF